MRPVLLDLCCCQGGAAKGYMDAGWDVIGVDVVDHSARYPGVSFVKGDALDVLDRYRDKVDAVHTSPPCQRWTQGNAGNDVSKHPDLIASHRQALTETDLPFIMENVPRSPLVNTTVLCGTMFGLVTADDDGTLLHLKRHRCFESNVELYAPVPCQHLRGVQWAGAYGGARRNKWEARYQRQGGYVPPEHILRKLLRIDWMDEKGMFQCVPPAYTEWLGKLLMRAVGAEEAALYYD